MFLVGYNLLNLSRRDGRDYARLVYCIGALLCKGSKGCVLNSTHIVFKVKPVKPLVKLQWWMQGWEFLWALKNPLDNKKNP